MKGTPAVESIPIISTILSRMPSSAVILAQDDLLTWLIQNTYSFDFVTCSVELLRDLLLATTIISSQTALPPSSLGTKFIFQIRDWLF